MTRQEVDSAIDAAVSRAPKVVEAIVEAMEKVQEAGRREGLREAVRVCRQQAKRHAELLMSPGLPADAVAIFANGEAVARDLAHEIETLIGEPTETGG